MHPAELSASTQDYVKTIWRLGEWEPERVTTTSLAAQMGLAPSTVSEALKKLTAQGLVDRPSYGAVQLTERGRDVAVHMVRRHRILEMFLATELGYPWDEVHDEAEVLEHAVTDRFIDRLDEKLGHPRTDPHGDVIPSKDGAITPPSAVPLADVTEPALVRVTRVSDADPRTLRLLGQHGIGPGSLLRVLPDPAARGAVRVRAEDDAAASAPGAPQRESPGLRSRGSSVNGAPGAAAEPGIVVEPGGLAAEPGGVAEPGAAGQSGERRPAREPARQGATTRSGGSSSTGDPDGDDGVELSVLVAEAVWVHRVDCHH